MLSVRRPKPIAVCAAVLLASLTMTVALHAPTVGAPSNLPAGTVRAAAVGPVILGHVPGSGEAIGSATPTIMVAYRSTNPLAMIAAVDFRLDGMNLTSAGTFNQTGFVLPLALKLRDGFHAANFTAMDTARAFGYANWTFLVDSDVPQINLTSPLAPLTNHNAVRVSGYVIDTMAVAVLVNGAPATFDANSGFFSTVLTLPDGIDPIVVVAADAGRHTGTAMTFIVVDTTPPTVTVSFPPDGLETNQSTVMISGTVNDVNATVLVDDQMIRPSADGHWRAAVALVQGSNAIQVTAVDAAGNRATPITLHVTYVSLLPDLLNRTAANERMLDELGAMTRLSLVGILLLFLAVEFVLYGRMDHRVRQTRSLVAAVVRARKKKP